MLKPMGMIVSSKEASRSNRDDLLLLESRMLTVLQEHRNLLVIVSLSTCAISKLYAVPKVNMFAGAYVLQISRIQIIRRENYLHILPILHDDGNSIKKN